jgi:hypothetical protein
MAKLDSTSLVRRSARRVADFFVAPASPAPLAAFRIGVATVLLLQALTLSRNLLDLYGNRGIVQWQVMDGTVDPIVPRLHWVSSTLGRIGVPDSACVQGVFLIYVAALAAMLLGYRTRIATVIAWLTQSIYGVDSFAQIALFYSMWAPVGDVFSLDHAAGRTTGEPSAAAHLGLRVIQIHLTIMYLSCGIEKSMGADWWNGEAIWCALMRRDLCGFDMSWLANVPVLARIACVGTLIVEGFYPIFIWWPRTRKVWAMLTVSLHVGIFVFMRLYSFSAIMGVFTASVFLVSADPAAVAFQLPALDIFRRRQPAEAAAC